MAESLIAFCEKLISVYFFSVDERKRNKGILKKRQFDLSGNRKVRVSDDFNIEFRLFRQDVV
ncbi:hypothetical protein, partial [Porphyromonas gingivalis]|uniref:hypothetical protein n=1 Tax=Porphyromonas gingivalis TaxID=837 RepID=UPI001C4E19C3